MTVSPSHHLLLPYPATQLSTCTSFEANNSFCPKILPAGSRDGVFVSPGAIHSLYTVTCFTPTPTYPVTSNTHTPVAHLPAQPTRGTSSSSLSDSTHIICARHTTSPTLRYLQRTLNIVKMRASSLLSVVAAVGVAAQDAIPANGPATGVRSALIPRLPLLVSHR